jgi:putative PEP-CTERM system TPR-repeat lipoprotein
MTHTSLINRSWPGLLRQVSLLALLLMLQACSGHNPEEYAELGRKQAAAKNHEAAVLHFKSALQERGEWPEVRLLLARSLLASGQREAAAAELAKLVTVPQFLDEAAPMLLEALLVGGEGQKAIALYGGLKLSTPAATARFKVQLAHAWLAVGNAGKAAVALNEALAADPGLAQARVMQIRMQLTASNAEDAARQVEAILAKDPSAKEAWLLKGELLLSKGSGSREAAEAAFRKALELDPKFVTAHRALFGSAVFNSDRAAAKKAAEQMRAAVPGHPLSVLTDAQLALQEGRIGDAEVLTQRLIQAFPDLPAALHLSGLLQLQSGSASQAVRHFRKALTIDPGLENTRLALASAELRAGQAERALVTLGPLIESASPSSQALALAADANLLLGDSAAAEALYLKAAKAEPDNLRHQARAAVVRLDGGSWADAMGDLQSISDKSKDTYADLALFTVHLKRGQFREALAGIDKMLAKQPSRASYWNELKGTVEARRRDLPKARAAFERAAELQPGAYSPVGRLVDLDVQAGDQAAALARLQRFLIANPKDAEAQLALALLTSRQPGHSVDQAREMFRAAVAAAPAEQAPRISQIEYLIRRSLFKEALSAAREAEAVLPDDPRVLDAVGMALLRAGDSEQAISTFRRLTSVMPNSALPHLRIAAMHVSVGAFDQAIVAFQRALDADPTSVAAHSGMVDSLLRSRKPPEALAYIKRLQTAKPRAALGYGLESAFHVRQRDDASAIRALRLGLDRTENALLAQTLVSLLLSTNRQSDAEAEVRAWLKRTPNHPEALYLQAAISQLSGNVEAAERQFRELVDLWPRHAAGLNNLAVLAAEKGRPDAIPLARRLVELGPDNAVFLDTLAFALAQGKLIDEAKQTHKLALELAPDDVNLQVTRAKIALLAGDKATARDAVSKLKALGDRHPLAQEAEMLSSRL